MATQRTQQKLSTVATSATAKATPSNEDCYYFFYSSCAKGNKCSFRHSAAALGTEEVCDLWLKGQCNRKICAFRHSIVDRQRAMIPCYWENTPSGCLKPHCVFQHSKPRPSLKSAIERVQAIKEVEGQVKLTTVKVKSLEQIKVEKELPLDQTQQSNNEIMFQLNKPASFKQQKGLIVAKASQPSLPIKHQVVKPLRRVVTHLPVAMDTNPDATNPYKYVAGNNESDKDMVANGNTSPAIFDVSQLFRSSTSGHVISSTTSDPVKPVVSIATSSSKEQLSLPTTRPISDQLASRLDSKHPPSDHHSDDSNDHEVTSSHDLHQPITTVISNRRVNLSDIKDDFVPSAHVMRLPQPQANRTIRFKPASNTSDLEFNIKSLEEIKREKQMLKDRDGNNRALSEDVSQATLKRPLGTSAEVQSSTATKKQKITEGLSSEDLDKSEDLFSQSDCSNPASTEPIRNSDKLLTGNEEVAGINKDKTSSNKRIIRIKRRKMLPADDTSSKVSDSQPSIGSVDNGNNSASADHMTEHKEGVAGNMQVETADRLSLKVRNFIPEPDAKTMQLAIETELRQASVSEEDHLSLEEQLEQFLKDQHHGNQADQSASGDSHGRLHSVDVDDEVLLGDDVLVGNDDDLLLEMENCIN